MAKVKVTKQIIEKIAKKDNSEFVRNINDKVNEVMSLAIENLAKKVSYISIDNVVMQPINEVFNNAFVDGSNYVYLLGIENAQLEMNTVKKESFWKRLKKKLIFVWKNRKAYKKKKRKRKKKKEQEETKTKNKEINLATYTIFDLAEDLQNSICNYMSETSLIYLDRNCIQIVGKEDLGSNVKVYIYLVSTEDEIFKYFISSKKGYLNINLPNRYNFLGEKQSLVGDNFTKMLKIINSLYFNVNGYVPNQIFVESVLYSCPDELFEGEDIHKVYLKIINFLSLKTIRHIKSINEPTKTIHEDKVCGNCGIGFNKMLEELGKEKI